MANRFVSQQFRNNEHVVKCSIDTLTVDGEIIDYEKQVFSEDNFYIRQVPAGSKLKTPLVLENTKQLEALDKRIFVKRFTYEIVRCLEICSFEDAVFIFKRVPKDIKYYINILQQITLPRWNQLLSSNQFFLTFFQQFEKLISKKDMSELRITILDEIISSKILKPFERLFYMFDNLVLVNQNLRNSIIGLNRRLVLQQMQNKNFFDVILLENYSGTDSDNSQTDGQNESDDNEATNNGNEAKKAKKLKKQNPSQLDKMEFPQNFLLNSVRAIRSCQRLKISNQIISSKILNTKFFQILKKFFKQYFQTQRLLLLEILAQSSQIQPVQLWKVTFEEGRTMKCKNLKFLEVLLTNSMINYTKSLKQKQKSKKNRRFNYKTDNQNPQKTSQQLEKTLLNSSEIKQTSIQSQNNLHSWQFSLIILQKFVTFQSPQRKKFCDNIINSLLSCKLISSELQFIIKFLQSSENDLIYQKKDIVIWKIIVNKIENLLGEFMDKEQKEEKKRREQQEKKNDNSRQMGQNQKMEVQNVQNVNNFQQQKQKRNTLSIKKLPFSKVISILLLKTYKILLKNQKKFQLNLNLQCLYYLLNSTKNCKGLIQGVRISLIRQFNQVQKSMDETNSMEEIELMDQEQ